MEIFCFINSYIMQLFTFKPFDPRMQLAKDENFFQVLFLLILESYW